MTLPSIPGVEEICGHLALDVLKYDSEWSLLSADPGITPDAKPGDTVDELDLAIIGKLQVDARRSNRSIAADLGVSEGSVRSRIKRLLGDRVIKIQAVSDPLGEYDFIAVDVAHNRMQMVSALIDEINQIPGLHRTEACATTKHTYAWDCTVFGSGALSVVMTLATSGEQDAVSEYVESCSAIHLSFDQFGFRVDAFDRAAAVGQGQARGDGVVSWSTPVRNGSSSMRPAARICLIQQSISATQPFDPGNDRGQRRGWLMVRHRRPVLKSQVTEPAPPVHPLRRALAGNTHLSSDMSDRAGSDMDEAATALDRQRSITVGHGRVFPVERTEDWRFPSCR